MPRLAILFGVLLILVGGGGYAITGAPTSLIPGGIGLFLVVFGIVANTRPDARKHAMHGAATVGLVGFLMGAAVLLRRMLSEGPVSTSAIATLSLMTVLCGVFVVLCVGSFVSARRLNPEAAAGLRSGTNL